VLASSLCNLIGSLQIKSDADVAYAVGELFHDAAHVKLSLTKLYSAYKGLNTVNTTTKYYY
jgi:hypothetical protein